MMGTSQSFISTVTLSMPNPAKADIMCSTVAISISPSTNVVAIEVGPTFSTTAFISTLGSKSTLLKTTP